MSRDRKRFILVGGLFVAWLVVLAALAATTANPVVVSRRLVAKADLVARVRIEGASGDLGAPSVRCAVVEALKGNAPAGSIVVEGLTAQPIGETHYALLTREALGRYRLMAYRFRRPRAFGADGPVHVPGPAALLPDTEFVRRQLLDAIRILAQEAAPAGRTDGLTNAGGAMFRGM